MTSLVSLEETVSSPALSTGSSEDSEEDLDGSEEDPPDDSEEDPLDGSPDLAPEGSSDDSLIPVLYV
ncbi:MULTISPECIES: hypothetical protein [Haloferacaceae]|uniref:Uncharacterized protein n=1 Tax=Halorubrum glutamatedens TaxID=2707018 RepID=A0ABD5QQM2_9EURY|nr:hypothetical protein [Halobellus captivus]